MRRLHDVITHPLVVLLMFLFAACSPEVPEPSNGWREVPSPRPDLQCWVRYNVELICAPSLTATHGAAQ